MRMRVDEAGCDQAAAEILHVINIDDVVDHARQALWQINGGAHPGDPLVLGDYGGVSEDLAPRPEPTDVGEETDRHGSTLVAGREPGTGVPGVIAVTCQRSCLLGHECVRRNTGNHTVKRIGRGRCNLGTLAALPR